MIYGHTFFGHNSAIFLTNRAATFTGTQETVIYRFGPLLAVKWSLREDFWGQQLSFRVFEIQINSNSDDQCIPIAVHVQKNLLQ